MSKINIKLLIPLCVIIGIQAGILIAFIVKPPAPNFDLLSFSETALGLMVAFLAIVGAFVVAFQWSNFESRLKETISEARAIARTQGKEQAYETFNTLVKQEVSTLVKQEASALGQEALDTIHQEVNNRVKQEVTETFAEIKSDAERFKSVLVEDVKIFKEEVTSMPWMNGVNNY